MRDRLRSLAQERHRFGYRRDLGNGESQWMQDISAPIPVQGRY